MRKTVLKRTSAAMVVVLAGAGTLTGLLRARSRPSASGTEVSGRVLYEDKGCAGCHGSEGAGGAAGPSLKGLFSRDELPVSGRPATEENVEKQLVDPYESMPSFEDKLSREEIRKLIEYMKTL